MKGFNDLGLNEEVKQAIGMMGFENPTEIQAKSISPILKGKDVIGESATGSGKTLAFGCGIAQNVKRGKGVQALVLTPTRELAEQVRGVVEELTEVKRLRVASIYGGVGYEPQIRAMQISEVIVATPGRLLDHMERRNISLKGISLLILDEVDRMLDMGFIDDVDKIISQCPKQKQVLFFSATMMPRIQKMANKLMRDPIMVTAEKMVDPSKLKQIYYDIEPNFKMALLVHLLSNEKRDLSMVFCNTRSNTEFVANNLSANGIKAIAIHGGLSQNKRDYTLNAFNSGKVTVLVCTDVAARGLDIDNVSHIYNYDIPKDPVDYVHRAGRTARAGEEGLVVNMLTNHDYDQFSRIQRDYSEFKIIRMQKPFLQRVNIVKNERRGRSFGGRGHSGDRRSPRGPRGGRNRSSKSGFNRSEGSAQGNKGSSGSHPHPKTGSRSGERRKSYKNYSGRRTGESKRRFNR